MDPSRCFLDPSLRWIYAGVHVDTSSIALGAVLAQPGEGSINPSIAFASRKLLIAEKNYTTTEREGLAMVYAL